MGEITREHERGIDWPYLALGQVRRWLTLHRYETAGFGLVGEMFGTLVEELRAGRAPEEVIPRTVHTFGYLRGKHIADRVRRQGKPLSLRSFFVYGDIATNNFQASSTIDNNDLVLKVRRCAFHEAAVKWGMGDYLRCFCEAEDHAIFGGYNQTIGIEVAPRCDTGRQFCTLRYIVKGRIEDVRGAYADAREFGQRVAG